MSVDAVLSSNLGLIVAPAGCGKTHLIIETLKVASNKPYLVLTHTTAGVAALKQRLKSHRVPNQNFVIATIDGWAMRISNMFPKSCDIKSSPESRKVFYPELRCKVSSYIDSKNIADAIESTYSKLLVDEYQDCDINQHSLICSLSEILPTIVFGDPMQCIFNFGGPMPNWDQDVKSKFPIIKELEIPWRWINAGTPELGEWLLNSRNLLSQGFQIDFENSSNYIKWKRLTGFQRRDLQSQVKAQYQIRKNYDANDSLLIIGNPYRPDSRHGFASVTKGIDVVEPVELSDIISLASHIDSSEGVVLSNHLLDSLAKMMTGIQKSKLSKRMTSILSGRNRTQETEIESAIKQVIINSDNASIENLLEIVEVSTDTRIYRKNAFNALKSAVAHWKLGEGRTMRQSAESIREQRRHHGDRRIPTKAIGSTLLLKGLEADHVLILDASEMNPQNLYVALSRGAKSITAFSSSPRLPVSV